MSQKIFCSLAYLFLLLRILLILNYTLKNFSLIKNKLRDRDQAEFLRSFKNNMINKILAPDTNTVRFFVFMVTYFVVSYRCLSQYYATEGKNWLENSCTIVFVSWVTCSMFNDGMDAWQVHLNIDKLYSSVPIFSPVRACCLDDSSFVWFVSYLCLWALADIPMHFKSSSKTGLMNAKTVSSTVQLHPT